jgi:PAS domain S-box-containing protein
METKEIRMAGRASGGLSAAQRYGISLLSVTAALLTALALAKLKFRDPEVPLFLFAVALSAWYGGPGPSAVAVFLSSAFFSYFFAEPLYSFYVQASDLPYFVMFVAFALLMAWFSTLRRRVEKNLREALDRLEIEVTQRTQQASLLNLTHDSIFVREMNDRIAYWNRGAQELYGWSTEEAVGKRSHDLLQTVFPAPIEEVTAQLLKTGRWDGELTHTRADGSKVAVSSRWALRRDEQGRPAAVLETNNDITDRKRREDEIQGLNQELTKRSTELQASNKELEAFAYSVSHDLRAPLRHMAGYTELLKKAAAGSLDDKSRRYIGMILDSAKRMGMLIDDLLSFSRIGRAETRVTMVSLEQLVKEIQAEAGREKGGRNVTWKIGPLPDLYGDRSMLRLVLVNLISNAVKFTRPRPDPVIEIGCAEQRRDGVVMFVRDNGVGFDMKYVNKLFGVFQRLHKAEEFEGTGIGLATVQRIIHRHGGQVWAEGETGSGATFYILLPTPQGSGL